MMAGTIVGKSTLNTTNASQPYLVAHLDCVTTLWFLATLFFSPHFLFYQYVNFLIMVPTTMLRSIEHVLGSRHERAVRKFKSHEGRSKVMVGEQSPHLYKCAFMPH